MRDWSGKPFYSLSHFLKAKFGEKVYRVSLDAGFTCPNRDGTLGHGGCSFCNESGARAAYVNPDRSVWDQLQEGKTLIRRRYGAKKFIAYFQAYTNTWAPIEVLERTYRAVLRDPDVVMLSIGTRPDCVSPEVLGLIDTVAKERPVIMEYGVQSLHDESLRAVHRGHLSDVSENAIKRTQNIENVDILAHCVFGLPGETTEMMKETVRRLVKMGVDAFKFHHLYLEKNTLLGKQYLEHAFYLFSREEYVDLLCEILPEIPEDRVIHRLFGQSQKNVLIAPLWTLNKQLNQQSLERAMYSRNLWQGCAL